MKQSQTCCWGLVELYYIPYTYIENVILTQISWFWILAEQNINMINLDIAEIQKLRFKKWAGEVEVWIIMLVSLMQKVQESESMG